MSIILQEWLSSCLDHICAILFSLIVTTIIATIITVIIVIPIIIAILYTISNWKYHIIKSFLQL